MRRSIWTRVLVALLVISMVATPVSASGWGSKSSKSSWGWGSIWDRWFGGGNKVVVTEPTEPEEDEPVLTLVEDASTVDNGEGLRASTYVLTSEEDSVGANAVNAYSLMAAADEADTKAGTTVKYFPVTMFNYDSRINTATEKKDPGTGDLQGMYFSDGSPYPKEVENKKELPAGQYYIQNIRASENRTDGASWLQAHADNKIYAEIRANASIWTLEVENGTYYLKTQINGVDQYMVVGTNGDNEGYTTTKTPIEIVAYSGNNAGVQLKQGDYYLCQWGGNAVQDFGGYYENNDGGNGMLLFAVDANGNVSSTPTTLNPGDAHENLTWAQVQAGTYYADEACTQRVTVNTIGESGSGYTQTSVSVRDIWNSKGNEVTIGDVNTFETNYYYYYDFVNKYYPVYIRNDGAIYYVQFCYTDYYNYLYGVGENWGAMFGIDDEVTLYTNSLTVTGYTLTAGDKTLARLYDTDTSVPVGVTLYTPGVTGTITRAYADWNWWNKGTGNNNNGDLIYTGLVQDTMVDDQIVFNVPEGGIFNDDTSVKDIYEYVGLPFVLKEYTTENNDEGKLGFYYSFDSDDNGAYFEDAPQSGSIDEFGNVTAHNLHFDEGNAQDMPTGVSVGDGSTNAFLPYNGATGYSKETADYHFGMRADLPFSMTPNGRINSTADNSAAIEFTFSGDDDVWVFIDGHLVIDLGGIHNRLDATINFANNTITYSEENAQDNDNSTASYNDSSFSMTQQLFTADGVEGVIPMSRDAFALDPDHEMHVFYLERGEGTSNCRIEFNLPMNDTVLVTKDATQSWSRSEEEANPDVEDAGVSVLTAAEQAIINNIDFGFTLYKKTANSDAFAPVANTNFYLVGRAVEGTVINQTDANGHFYLKNGQSAKFITEIPTEGVTYYVVEDKVPDGFVSPDFNFAGEATYDYTYTDGTVSDTASAADASEIPEQIIDMPKQDADGNWYDWAVNKSYEVTVKGSVEANDSIEFICSNYLDAELPNPTALAYEDIIVLDYGLPVNIDPLHNDVFRGDNIEIIAFGGANMELGEIVDKDGDKVFEESELDITPDDGNFHSGSVVLNDKTYSVDDKDNVTRDTFTYTLNKQLTEVEVITYIIKVTGQEKQEATEETLTQYDYAIGKVYIVPATVMYYEENFSDLVTFTNNSKTGNAWRGTVETDGASANQEPGVVGTTTDSIYGSDVAYLNDSFDSNGTSRYCDTTNGALQFSYTFTGTGTTIFARTSDTTGYVQFKLYEGTDTSGTAKYITYRDTYWKDENTTDLDEKGTLYNIPIYTQEDLVYGTYTVVATVAKAGTKTAGNDNGSGKDFWLDGIRIMQPLNEGNDTVIDEEGTTITEKALGAYATDGESNIDTVTLRNKLITDDQTGDNAWNFAVLTDIEGEVILAEDYVSIGPKEEVYLTPGQTVSFGIKYWHRDGYRMHMGMKAPFGTASVQVGKNTYDLANTVDCYYDITDTQYSVVTKYEPALNEAGFPIYKDAEGNAYYKDAEGNFYTAEGNDVEEEIELTPVYDETAPYYFATYTFTATDSIVSLTNIKIVGNYEFSLVDNVDREVDGGSGEG